MMSRGFKIVGGILAVVVVAIVGVVVFIYSNLDSIVKDAVEEYGPQYTGVSVKLAKVELSPENGEGKLTGLVVGNPKGYLTDSAFKLGSISMNIDISSLTSDTIIIKSIVIDKPEITYEFGDGGSNVDVIGKNVEKAAGGGGAKEEKKSEEPGKKMIIESLIVSNGNVSVSHPLLQGKTLGSGLPTIRLKDIGKDKKDGASPAEVVDTIMNAIEKQVGASVGGLNVDGMVKDLTKGVEDAAKDALKNVTGGADGATKGVEDAAKGAGDSLKKLFGK
ncbi:MAG: hypothetical protein HOI96_01280 [Rhodospirillaceae bacterium]|jgi:hypothetical protein|nr:hypothetical protein [Rhodospirillaceae bacterium]